MAAAACGGAAAAGVVQRTTAGGDGSKFIGLRDTVVTGRVKTFLVDRKTVVGGGALGKANQVRCASGVHAALVQEY